MRRSLALIPFVSWVMTAGCAAQPADDVEEPTGTHTSALCPLNSDCLPDDTVDLPVRPVVVSHAPAAQLEIGVCVKNLGGAFDDDLKAMIATDVSAAVPGTWVDTVCVGDVERIGIWLAAPTATDTQAQRQSALSATTILKAGEGFAAKFGSSFISKAVSERWKAQPKTLDGAGLIENMAIVPDKVHLSSLSYSLVSPNHVDATLKGDLVASVLGFPFTTYPFTARSSDLLWIGPNQELMCTSPKSPVEVDGLPDTTLDEPLVHIGCPFVEALPKSIPMPFTKTKRVFLWQRVSVDANGIAMGATTKDVLRTPTVTISGPKTFVIDEIAPVKGMYRFDTTDMRAPLTAKWSAPAGVTISAPNGLATWMTFAIPNYMPAYTSRIITVDVTDADGVTKQATYGVALKKDLCVSNPHIPDCM